MYKLPNGKKIDEDAVVAAMLDIGAAGKFYLDYTTGQVVSQTDRQSENLEFGLERYHEIPKLTEADIISWMAELARELIACEDPVLAASLIAILRQDDPINNFHAAIEGDWSYGWPQWEGDKCYEEMEKWLDTLPFKAEDDWQEFFEENCDCPICQAMAQGRTDEKSIKDAFREAKFKQVMGDIEKPK